MDKQKLMPQAAQPVNRISSGQLPAELAELSEEALQLHGDLSASLYEDYCQGNTCNVTCGCSGGFCRRGGCDCVW